MSSSALVDMDFEEAYSNAAKPAKKTVKVLDLEQHELVQSRIQRDIVSFTRLRQRAQSFAPLKSKFKEAPTQQQIKEKQEFISELKKKLYTTRFSKAESLDELKIAMRQQLFALRTSEDQMRVLRLTDFREFQSQLNLEAINLDISLKAPQPALPRTDNTLAKRRVITVSKPVSGMSENWRGVLAVTDAANKWKRVWEGKKMQAAQQIMDDAARSPSAALTKDQILELRSALFRLKQKKHTTPKEKLLMEHLKNRLKNMDKSFLERTQSKKVNSPN